MYKGFLHTHTLAVTLFLIIYLVKTILLLSDRKELLASFNRRIKVPEMIISALFLVTGIYLATQLPFNGQFDYLFWIKLVMVFTAIPVAIVGFKRANKILAALSLLLITGSYGIAEVYGKRKGIAKTTEETTVTASEGESLYRSKCSLCHGDDGKLGAAGAKDISVTALDHAGIVTTILEGKGMMSPVMGVSPEEAETIAQYVDEHIRASAHP